MKRNDIILLVAAVAIGVALLTAFSTALSGSGDTVVVTVDGKEYARYPLDENLEVVIEGINGGTNTLVIKDGQAYITQASCPDKICMNTGVATELRSVVCLPNRVVVSIEKGS